MQPQQRKTQQSMLMFLTPVTAFATTSNSTSTIKSSESSVNSTYSTVTAPIAVSTTNLSVSNTSSIVTIDSTILETVLADEATGNCSVEFLPDDIGVCFKDANRQPQIIRTLDDRVKVNLLTKHWMPPADFVWPYSVKKTQKVYLRRNHISGTRYDCFKFSLQLNGVVYVYRVSYLHQTLH